MQNFLGIIVLILLITGCKQPQEPIEHLPPRITAQDVKFGEVKKNGLVREGYGLTYSKCHYIDGIKEGVCQYFYKEQLERVENYHQGKLDGESIAYSLDGTVIKKTRYSNGYREYHVVFDPHGKMLKEEFYRKQEDVPYEAYEYDQDGKRMEIPIQRYLPHADPWFRDEKSETH